MSATPTTTYNRPTDVKLATREAWLEQAADHLIGRVLDSASLVEGCVKPSKLRVSCGWPSRGALMTASSTKRTLGQAFHSANSADEAREVFISPALAEECRVLDVLLHELIHACLPAGVGHGPDFAKVMRAVGLAGKPTATVASDELLVELQVLAHQLGRYPHEKLDVDPGPRKPGRMVKGYCPDCETILYGSRAAWDNATPKCGNCDTPYVVEPSPAQALHWGLTPGQECERLENVASTVELRTQDGRFTLRSTKTGKREGVWYVTDHRAQEVGTRTVTQLNREMEEVEVEVVEHIERYAVRRDRADALAFIAAIREGELTWDEVELEDDEDDEDDYDLGELGDWTDEEGDHLDDDEDEELDFDLEQERHEEEPDAFDPEEYERLSAYREASGARTSARIIADGGTGALD